MAGRWRECGWVSSEAQLRDLELLIPTCLPLFRVWRVYQVFSGCDLHWNVPRWRVSRFARIRKSRSSCRAHPLPSLPFPEFILDLIPMQPDVMQSLLLLPPFPNLFAPSISLSDVSRLELLLVWMVERSTTTVFRSRSLTESTVVRSVTCTKPKEL